MKILIILFIFAILLGPNLFENSYGQTTESQKKPAPKMFFQIQLRDKEGHLYGYIQPALQIFDMDRIITWIAPHATNSSIIYEGNSYLLMTLREPYVRNNFEQLGGYFLNVSIDGRMTNVFYAHYDSYLANTGDTATHYWEILIPLQ